MPGSNSYFSAVDFVRFAAAGTFSHMLCRCGTAARPVPFSLLAPPPRRYNYFLFSICAVNIPRPQVAKERAMESLVLPGCQFALSVLGEGKAGPATKQLLKPFAPGEKRFGDLPTREAANGATILTDAVSRGAGWERRGGGGVDCMLRWKAERIEGGHCLTGSAPYARTARGKLTLASCSCSGLRVSLPDSIGLCRLAVTQAID